MASRFERKRGRIAKLEERLGQYYKAEKAITEGAQEYSVDGTDFKKGNLEVIRSTIAYLEDKIDSLSAGLGSGITVYNVVVKD